LSGHQLFGQANKASKLVRVYTVNNEKRMLRCIRYDCQAIIIDIPKLVTNLNFN